MLTIQGQCPIHLHPTRAAAQAVCDRLNQDPDGDEFTIYQPCPQPTGDKWLVQVIDTTDDLSGPPETWPKPCFL